MARRRLGQQMLLDKQKKDEELIRKQAEEVRRDKLEQQKLQEKLKAQIQQDREDKRRKYEQEQVPTSQPTKPAAVTSPTTPPVNYTRSRLQFRLGDGSFFTEDFSADAHMNDVYAYLQETLPADQYRRGSYVLRTIHTRVTLTHEETGSLKELELVPSAVLLVIPRGNTSSPSTALTTTNMFQPITVFFAWFMMQLNFLYQFITSRLFGGGEGGRPASTANRQTPTRSPPQGPAKKSKENFRTDSTEASTIRRFHNTQDDSDDEEKRTWNGNSTQQL